jgi:hypothetical protein
MFYIGKFWGVWNGLIQFTLFIMGKFNSKLEQLESPNRLLKRIVFEVRGSTVLCC